VPAFSAAEIARLLSRGDWLFATGDVASARRLYERAADAGEAQAAMKLGETFDPVFLDHSHLRGLHGDPGTAVFWLFWALMSWNLVFLARQLLLLSHP